MDPSKSLIYRTSIDYVWIYNLLSFLFIPLFPSLFIIIVDMFTRRSKNIFLLGVYNREWDRNLHMMEDSGSALVRRCCCSFFQLLFLALEFQSCRHRTLLKTVPPLRILVPYIRCQKKEEEEYKCHMLQ